MYHRGKFVFGILLIALFLSACARSPNVKQYFFSGVPEHTRHFSAKTSQILLVSSPVAAPSYQSKDMQYVQQPYQLSQFARHAWASPPAEMLAPLLVQTLQNTGRFYAVVSPPYVGSTDFRLDTKLLALYQEFQGKRSQVVLEIQVDLMDVAQSRLLKSQQFCVRVDTPENTPYGGVIATNQAVREILSRIAIFVAVNSNSSKMREMNIYELPKPIRS